MRALITGITGFVGSYLAEYLHLQGVEVFGTTSQKVKEKSNISELSLHTSEEEIIRLLEKIKPDHIYHLAGFSNVKDSWNEKNNAFSVNVSLTINLLEAARKSAISDTLRILTVGSSEEYGRVANATQPISEIETLQPMNPYGISKAAVSHLARQYYYAYGLKVVHARPFNHIGPGQRLGFVVPDFSSQIINMEKNQNEKVIKVGNLDAQRDFTDVRDIVRAYYYLLMEPSTSGEVFNVCSGVPVPISFLLQQLIRMSNQDIKLQVDESKLRPSDIPVYIGDNKKIIKLTGWKPQIPLETTLIESLEYLRQL
ncbi:hypothetical protein BK120_18090 [Paenibacillus sp. FSL A5-0031]|uniref:GDP-mannose 4,6-dehydratase n=1 Tax=Paenibacillus sp. FSL A5-0031 TaxID=1920420 RepID=UPI00096F90D4|nr:GDP-mannose 4,6-dehydratase [Paenibacillus sp. FSL A5-0031]OME80601.1 hypothetical protein BK120_18090 [Paenibacillus sp. FSL A5-0031]